MKGGVPGWLSWHSMRLTNSSYIPGVELTLKNEKKKNARRRK